MDSEQCLFDLDTACTHEMERRLGLLGEVAYQDYNYERLVARAKLVFVRVETIWNWWHAHHKHGKEGLRPMDWKSLSEKNQNLIRQRLAQLGGLAEAVEISPQDIEQLATQNSWSLRTAGRWVERYRSGGLWSLARPSKAEREASRQRKSPPARSLASLDETALAAIEGRLRILGDLVLQHEVTREAVKRQADLMNVSERTIWDYLSAYRAHKLLGLAPKQRSDKAAYHRLSPRMVEVIRGLRYNNPKRSIRAVYDEACQRAQALGEQEPTEWQVRTICEFFAKPDLLLAEGREDAFKSDCAITIDMKYIKEWDNRIIFEIDHTQVDVLARDIRSKKYRKKSETIRPWLTLCIERRSRLIMGAIFSYDYPDRHTVAAVLREAILMSEEKPYGGIPDEVWVDRGKELLAGHIQQFTQELKVILHPCKPHYPQEKGEVERDFGMFNTRLWSGLAGYVDSNTVERNPNAKAELTIAELEEKFKAFVRQYHQEVHSQTGSTPLDYWMKHCWAEPAEQHDLDRLLKEAKGRKVLKAGIKYDGRVYWHQDLAPLVQRWIVIRAEPNYTAPDEVEVYYQDKWICTAFAMNSPRGKAIKAEEVREAKQNQRNDIKGRIRYHRQAVEDADRTIEQLQQAMASSQETGKDREPPAPTEDAAKQAQPEVDIHLFGDEARPRPKRLRNLLDDEDED